MASVVAQVKRLHAEGAQIYLWSTGGAEYAAQSAKELGIEACVTQYLPKPTVYIDDQAVHDWRECKHVLPGNAGDV
jgi:hypothetical protein